ncbi:hypothetical protein GIB67_013583, partial [Kingdonia uniflora]
SIDDGDLIAKLLPKINDGGDQEEPIKPLILRYYTKSASERNNHMILTEPVTYNYTNKNTERVSGMSLVFVVCLWKWASEHLQLASHF